MSKDVALTDKISISKQVALSLEWLKAVPDQVHQIINDDPKQAVDALRRVEMLEVSAKKIKLNEVSSNAALARFTIMREVGAYLLRNAGTNKGGKDAPPSILKRIGLTSHESVDCQKIAGLEEYHWEYALKACNTVKGLVGEADRYVTLKGMIDATKLKHKDVKLKQFVLDGLSPFYAEQTLKNELKPVTSDAPVDGDDDDWDSIHSGKENDEDEVPAKLKGKQKMSDKDIDILESNIIDIAEYFGNFISFLENAKSLTQEQYERIVKGVSDLNKRMVSVKEATKAVREKIT